MDRNFFLAFALSFVVLTGWMMFQAEQRKELEALAPEVVAEGQAEGGAQAGEAPLATSSESQARERSPAPASPSPVTTPIEEAQTPSAPEVPEEIVQIEGPHYVAELTTHGAALTHWELKDFSELTRNGRKPVVLTTAEPPEAVFARTPLRGLGLGDLGRAAYTIEARSEDAVSFVLVRDGITVRKRWGFDRDAWSFRLTFEVENRGARMVSPTFEVAWPAEMREGADYGEQSLVALHEGSVERERLASLGTPGFFGSFFGGGDPKAPKQFVGDIGWTGVDLRYFLTALVPDRGRTAEAIFRTLDPGRLGEVVLAFEAVDLPPGQKSHREFRGFLGPKREQDLDAFGDDVTLAVNRGYSILAPLVKGFEWLLTACYSIIPNYGVAIIILTILVRLVTAPIMARQMRSMERMRELQPRMKEIQERFADDRQAQSEAMMKMYKEVGFNPLGGCLPMFLQLPVFIGLFYALQSSFELRQAPFFGWINDLSAPETLFMLPGLDVPVRMLPLLMGISMVAQQKLTPTTIDPAQARMMTVMMPVMFVFLFYQFPSGLVLYWMMSNLLGIAHQLWMNRAKAKAA